LRVLLSIKCLPVARRVRIAKVTPRGVLLATNDVAVLGATSWASKATGWTRMVVVGR
jgi:hypothetical protein